MRRILIDHARHPPPPPPVDPADLDKLAGSILQIDLIALDDALTKLSQIDPRQAEVVDLHHFGGRTLQETADILGVSRGTVKNDWNFAKAWLHRELTRGDRS